MNCKYADILFLWSQVYGSVWSYLQMSSFRISKGVYRFGESGDRNSISGVASAWTLLVVGTKWTNQVSDASGCWLREHRQEKKKEIRAQVSYSQVQSPCSDDIYSGAVCRAQTESAFGSTVRLEGADNSCTKKEPSWTSDTRAGIPSPSVEIRRPAIYETLPSPQMVADITRKDSNTIGSFKFCQAVKRIWASLLVLGFSSVWLVTFRGWS